MISPILYTLTHWSTYRRISVKTVLRSSGRCPGVVYKVGVGTATGSETGKKLKMEHMAAVKRGERYNSSCMGTSTQSGFGWDIGYWRLWRSRNMVILTHWAPYLSLWLVSPNFQISSFPAYPFIRIIIILLWYLCSLSLQLMKVYGPYILQFIVLREAK